VFREARIDGLHKCADVLEFQGIQNDDDSAIDGSSVDAAVPLEEALRFSFQAIVPVKSQEMRMPSPSTLHESNACGIGHKSLLYDLSRHLNFTSLSILSTSFAHLMPLSFI
jgi:hypothetical protein